MHNLKNIYIYLNFIFKIQNRNILIVNSMNDIHYVAKRIKKR